MKKSIVGSPLLVKTMLKRLIIKLDMGTSQVFDAISLFIEAI